MSFKLKHKIVKQWILPSRLYKPHINTSGSSMDLNENFVVTSKNGTGADFIANFAGPIRVQRAHKLALRSIFYGQVFNVTTKNNLLLLVHKTKGSSPVYELSVEPGFKLFYTSILSLTEAISTSCFINMYSGSIIMFYFV